MLSSVIGGGIEHILDMEMNEFTEWIKAAAEFKCVRQEKRLEHSW
ncbi:MAG: hypothetical protein PG978_000706 [Wolbachia endosymbiont of Ctenocephalides felis wCfeF]|nr:MAG: hypothetical protein PG978_000706 [Wolbachia endosymbiont of Ctenocephalides felis wCfeF]